MSSSWPRLSATSPFASGRRVSPPGRSRCTPGRRRSSPRSSCTRSARTRTVPRPTWTSCWRSASAPRRLPEHPAASAVIAGAGERLGAGGPKAFVPLAGRPLVEWSLEAFARAQSVGPVIVAVPAGCEDRVGDAAAAVVGGDSRSESVAAGLERVETELVAVHDAARPLVTAELIDDLVEKLLDRPD